MDIGNESFGPQGGHWGAQINLVGSLVDHLVESKGSQIFDAIDSVSEEDAPHVMFELIMRVRVARGDYGGGQDPVV